MFGITGVLIALMSMFYRLPVLFLIALLMGMGEALTGLLIRNRWVYLSGFAGMALSLLCFFFRGVNRSLIFAFIFIVIMIIPGHMLNYKSNRPTHV